MFRFMEKYRVHILLVVLLAMVGFGAWAELANLLGRDGSVKIAPEDVFAKVELFGQKQSISREEVKDVWRSWEFVGNQDQAGAVLASILRDKIAESEHGYPVSQEEIDSALKERFVDSVREMNDGKFDAKVYAEFVGRFFQMTPAQFEAQVAKDLRLAKTMREFVRAGSLPPLSRVLETAQKDNQKVKLKGVFWDVASHVEAARLPRDENENLTAEAIAMLREYFDGLADEEKRTLVAKGAMVSVAFLGFDFGLYADDQALLEEFDRVDETSGKSLAQITAGIEITEKDVTVMKARLAARREFYGLAADADVEAAYLERQARFDAEIRIAKLHYDIWKALDGEIKAGREVDLEKVAADNNLTSFEWRDRYLLDLAKAGISFQSPELMQMQLPTLLEGQLLDVRFPPGTKELRFGDNGPADIEGKHVAVFQLRKREMQPLANFNDPDVREILVTRIEKKRAEELRDAEFDRFQARMDELTGEKAKEKIEEIRADIDKQIADAIKDLDPEKEEDKAKIDAIKTEKEDEAKVLVDEARAPYRSEAFDKILEESPEIGLVVEEGYFRPFDSTREQPVDREADFDVRARSSLRREFRSLHDQNTMEIYVEEGTVSDIVNSTSYPGMKGIAKIVDKKAPSERELLLRPEYLRISAMNTARAINKERGERDLWDYEAMQERNFKVEPMLFAEGIERFEKDAAERERKKREFEEGMRKMQEERQKAATPDKPLDQMTPDELDRKAREKAAEGANPPQDGGMSAPKPGEKSEDEKAQEEVEKKKDGN